uniref:Uncharacterized protein n=1 Tax=Trichogramma kaykai TaxID=54128 RepID=A0ABD2XEN5_9HYME
MRKSVSRSELRGEHSRVPRFHRKTCGAVARRFSKAASLMPIRGRERDCRACDHFAYRDTHCKEKLDPFVLYSYLLLQVVAAASTAYLSSRTARKLDAPGCIDFVLRDYFIKYRLKELSHATATSAEITSEAHELKHVL